MTPVDRTGIVSRYPLPERFHSVYRTNGKYALIPAGIGLVMAVLVYFAALNYDHDMLQTVATGVLFVVAGVYIGNTKVRNLTASFQSHSSVTAMSKDSGVSADAIAKMLTRFALHLETGSAPLGDGLELVINLNQEEKSFEVRPAS